MCSLNKILVASALASIISLGGCMSTSPTLGGGSGNTVTGGAAGGSSANNNTQLEKCDTPIGTASIFEDQQSVWWRGYYSRYPKLGSTTPVIRTMIQQSNCFVIVERGAAMAAMNRERQLAQSGQLRTGSNIGGGQMVTADFTISPEIQFADETGGVKAAAGALLGGLGTLIGGSLGKNEASTTLLLLDNRSGIQVSAAVGSASNYDFGFLGGLFGGGFGGGAQTFSKTPEGKVIVASFADSYNQMVKALRNYKPQRVQGGLGTGGGLEIDGQVQATQGASIVEAPSQPADVVIETRSQTRVTSNSVRSRDSYNFEIDEYDEEAFNKYYQWLKDAAPVYTALAAIGSDPNANIAGGMNWHQALAFLVGQLDTHRIELEAWPYDARAKAWQKMGKRIESHTKIFERNRKAALATENLDPTLRSTLESIQLVTKETLLPEGV
ncbi:hypothetical protein [Agaribacter flavus]|uniref:Curli production assembly/transport component CsgG n=1 Tax=Agaribacter flavus TaxID=1902781 RepID=A0ABV7FK46_9ALTE